MDKILEAVGVFLVSQGWAGISFLLVCYACYRLFNLYVKVMEARAAEGPRMAEALLASVETLKGQAEVLRGIKEELEKRNRSRR